MIHIADRPPGPLRVDWNHRLAEGLVDAWYVEDAHGSASTGATRRVSARGHRAISYHHRAIVSPHGPAFVGDAGALNYICWGSNVGGSSDFPMPAYYSAIGRKILTVVCTAKFDVWGTGASSEAAVSLYASGGVSHWYLRKQGTNQIRFNLEGGATLTVSPSPALSASGYYRIVGTADGRNMRVYIDGRPQGSTAATGSPSTAIAAGSGLGIGVLEAIQTLAMDGQIVEARAYYGVCWSPGDVLEDFADPWAIYRHRRRSYRPPSTARSSTVGATTGGAEAAASCTSTPPTFAATAASEVGGTASAATATFTPPTFTATAACEVGGAASAATATHTPPTFSATIASEVGGAAAAATAVFATAVFSATAAAEPGGAAAAASATFTPPTFTATVASEVGGAAAAVSCAFSPPVFSAAIACEAGGAAAALTATAGGPTRTASMACEVGGAASAATATFAPPVFSCTVACEVGGAAAAATDAIVADQGPAYARARLHPGPRARLHPGPRGRLHPGPRARS